MNLAQFTQQLARDLKASAAKTAVLGLLLIVGLCFWVPPLLKAFASGAPAAKTAPTDTAAAVARTSATTNSAAPNATAVSKQPHDSATVAKLLRGHPLLQPAGADEMPDKPFGLNDELLPLPVLIAEDALAEPPLPNGKSPPKLVEKLDGLMLKSTLVGPTRRAALINHRLFQEGQSVPWKDKQLRLDSVTRKSVTLTDGSQSWQLKLEDSRGESEE